MLVGYRSPVPGTETASRKSADDWVLAGLRSLAAGSINDVKVERLAGDLGVTKGSFYWHFEGRDALLAAMLDRWVQLGTDAFIELANSGPDQDPAAMLETLFGAVLQTPDEFDGSEAAIRDWAAGDPVAARVCAEVDARRLEYVATLLAEAGAPAGEARKRADVLYRIVIGENVWRRYGGDPVDLDAVMDVIRHQCRP